MAERFCTWFHKYRLVLLAAWIVHAFIIHYYFIGFPSWDGFSYRVPPVVELMQHGEIGGDRYNQWALQGFVPFAELIHMPFLMVFGLTGLIIGYPLFVFPLCVIAVYKLVRQLTGSVHGGNFGALAYAAIPLVNQQPFTGYIDFIVSAVVAYFMYAMLKLRESPRPYRAAIRLILATIMVTMTRTTGLYIGIMMAGLIALALFVRRDGYRIRIIDARILLITAGALLVGAFPAAAIQVYKYLEYGSPIYPYQFKVLGIELGTGVPMKGLFFFAGLPDETWYHFGKASLGAWLWPRSPHLWFFDSRNMGGGFVLPIALVLVPTFLRTSTGLEKWLCVTCLVISFLARDFWLPRWAYTIVVMLAVVIGRSAAELARSQGPGRWLFWFVTAALALHLARPEFDLRTIQRGGIGPRLNVSGSSKFITRSEGFEPYPDRHWKFVIIEMNWNGFVVPLYGRRLTNEVLSTVRREQLGERCAGLRSIVAQHPDVLFIDDQNLTQSCDRSCAYEVPGWCRAYKMFPRTQPAAVNQWLGASAEGAFYLTSGWSFPEAWGTWAAERVATITIPIPIPIPIEQPPGRRYQLDLRWHAPHDHAKVQVEIAGARHEVAFGPKETPREDTFTIESAASPIVVRIIAHELTAVADGRELGVGITALRLRHP